MTTIKVNFCIKDGSELTIELIQINQSGNRLIHTLGKTESEGVRKKSFINVRSYQITKIKRSSVEE